MNIPATELKHALKKLSPVRAETYQIGEYLSAQDSDVWVLVGLNLGLGETFSINGKKLTQVINRMSGQIELECKDRYLVLKSARATVELEIQKAPVPKMPEDPEGWMTFSAGDFKKAVERAVAQASTNKSAHYGGVIQVRSLPADLETGKCPGYCAVGTDGNSLSVISVPGENSEFKVLLNLEAAQIVQLMDETVSFGETESHLKIQSGDTTVYSSKPNKDFPDYPKFVPAKFDFTISLDAEELTSALRTIEPLIDEEADKGGVAVQIRENVLYLKNLSTGSTASDSAACEQLDPDPIFEPKEIQLKIAAKYLSNFSSKMTGPMTLSFLSPLQPVKMSQGNITTVAMPIGPRPKK